MGVRILGILVSEKVVVVTRVASGFSGRIRMFYAVDVEYCFGGRGMRFIKDFFFML